MANTTINELKFFIKAQQNLGNEIILINNANETTNCWNSNILKKYRTCKLCDPIAMKHGTATYPNTYSRKYGRIDFILCSSALLPFISSADILPFGTMVFSDHRGLYIDIHLHQFLRTPDTDLVTNTGITQNSLTNSFSEKCSTSPHY